MLCDDPLDPDTFHAFAAHEAAHATVTSALQIEVRRILVVQLTAPFKRLYDGQTPKESCSHSQPDPQQYKDAGPAQRCTIARAGEVGQRIHLGAAAVLSLDHWLEDFKEIEFESKLSGPELEELVESLGTTIGSWLREPGPNRTWKNLTEVLTKRRMPHPADRDGFRYELEGKELQSLLSGTPEFPAALLPDLPPKPNGSPS
jgi:hypothetical protein